MLINGFSIFSLDLLRFHVIFLGSGFSLDLALAWGLVRTSRGGGSGGSGGGGSGGGGILTLLLGLDDLSEAITTSDVSGGACMKLFVLTQHVCSSHIDERAHRNRYCYQLP